MSGAQPMSEASALAEASAVGRACPMSRAQPMSAANALAVASAQCGPRSALAIGHSYSYLLVFAPERRTAAKPAYRTSCT